MKLKHPSGMIVVGPSQSGKTTLVREIINKQFYNNVFSRIRWCYNYYAPWFLEESAYDFVQGLPENFERNELIIIDDMMHRLSEKIADLFTEASHHCNISVILILQNLFPKSRFMRDISLNSQYIFLFKSPRDMSQVNCLARQLYPQNPSFLMDAYKKTVSHSYKPLFLDLHPETDENLRVREGLFPDDNGVYWFYQPK